MSGFDETKVKTYFIDNYRQGDLQGDHEAVDVAVKSYAGSTSVKIDVSRVVCRGRGVRRYNLGWMSSVMSRALAKMLLQAADCLDGMERGNVPPVLKAKLMKNKHKGVLANIKS
jgi:hypothetical protein